MPEIEGVDEDVRVKVGVTDGVLVVDGVTELVRDWLFDCVWLRVTDRVMLRVTDWVRDMVGVCDGVRDCDLVCVGVLLRDAVTVELELCVFVRLAVPVRVDVCELLIVELDVALGVTEGVFVAEGVPDTVPVRLCEAVAVLVAVPLLLSDWLDVGS